MQVVANRTAACAFVKSGALQPDDYLDLRGVVTELPASRACWAWRSRPNYATSGRVYVNFVNASTATRSSRGSARSAGDPLRADPGEPVRFHAGPTASASSPSRSPTTTAATSRSGPTASSTSGWATAGGQRPDPSARRIRRRCSARCCASTSPCPTAIPKATTCPPNNPFVGQAGVLGGDLELRLRNPWRWSFDDPARGGTGALVIGDVGQGACEEIDYEPAGRGGRNYGWRNREGAHNNVTNLPPFSTPLIDPIFEYPRGDGQSVTGGFVYRGTALGAAFRGRYFFADFVSSRVWSLGLTIKPAPAKPRRANADRSTRRSLARPRRIPRASASTRAGELYVVSYGGTIRRLRN